MKKLARMITNHSKIILVVKVVLLVPAIYGFIKTDINYDSLSYLPYKISTTKAEEIFKNDFDCGSLAMLIVENMEDKDVVKLKEKVSKVDGVKYVMCKDDLTDLLYRENSTMMVVKLEKGTADIKTQNAVGKIRNICAKQIFLTSIAMSILYDFGTNVIFGEISYITKILCAVL